MHSLATVGQILEEIYYPHIGRQLRMEVLVHRSIAPMFGGGAGVDAAFAHMELVRDFGFTAYVKTKRNRRLQKERAQQEARAVAILA